MIVSVINAFDRRSDALFTSLRDNRLANKVFYYASEAADFSRAWHAMAIVMACLSPTLWKDTLRLMIALGVESAIVNGAIKSLFKRQRPEVLPDAPYKVRRPKTSSFPSGHASSACLTALLLSDALPSFTLLLWLLALIVAASRIHNRMHYGSDVVAGLIIGTSMGWATIQLFPLR